MTTDTRFTVTEPTVMAFPALIEPRPYKRNGKASGEAKYSGSFLLSPDSEVLKALKAHAVMVAKAKWPTRDIAADFKAGNFTMPWKSGDKIADKDVAKQKAAGVTDEVKLKRNDFMRGKVVLKASSKFPVKLAILNGGKFVDLEGDAIKANAGKFFFGCEVLASFNFQAYDAVKDGDSDGVTAYLDQIVSLNKGKKLGGSGAASAAERFSGYRGTMTTEDPTGGAEVEELSEAESW